MASIVIFGGTGYAGGAIGAEAVRRGHSVTSVSPSGRPAPDGVMTVQGSIGDVALLDKLAASADVWVVALRAVSGELGSALPTVLDATARHDVRIGVVGGTGSLHVSEGGPRVVDLPDFPEAYKGEALAHADVLAALRAAPPEVDWFYVSPAATFGAQSPGQATGTFRTSDDVLLTDADGNSYISGADFATAFVNEIDSPAHSRQRFHVAY
ncbi:MAG TPA: NAD(P)H-binding protein [Streptosporangiaceae bacterium]